MSVSLYRKYRPQNFASVVGQKSAVDVLTRSIERNRVGHAYLFSGSRGCGKTSVARIFAKALNCLSPEGFEPCGKCRNCIDITSGDSLDVIEIDGASNNGVENIRGLKENVTLAPFNSRYKIYIIDEVHMLSQGAFNALLKTLEEPPEHVIFIMATTEPHKVPVTIRSRCQHIPFHSITPDDIFARLEYVCQSENISYEPEALREIARQSDGALRDALSLLEQVTAAGDVTVERVESIFGAGSRPAFERWVKGLRENPEGAYGGLKAMFDAGASAVRVFEEMFSLLRDLWLVSKWKSITESLSLSEQDKKFLVEESANWKTEELHLLLEAVLRILTQARSGVRNDILLGMFMLFIEKTPQYSAPENFSIRPKPQSVVQTVTREHLNEPASVTAAEPVNIVPAPVKEDTALKEELLKISETGNFLLYCALFDARPYRRGDALVLDMEHRYCYEVMRVDRNAAELSGMFGEYGNVVLRYGLAEYPCPKNFQPLQEQETQSPVEVKAKPSARKFSSAANENEQAMPEPEEPETKQAPSVFGDLVNSLRSVGLKPEVIVMKHSVSDDTGIESDDTDNLMEEEEMNDD